MLMHLEAFSMEGNYLNQIQLAIMTMIVMETFAMNVRVLAVP